MIFCLLKKGGKGEIYFKLSTGSSQFPFPGCWQVESLIHWGLGPEGPVRPPAPPSHLALPSASIPLKQRSEGEGLGKEEDWVSLALFWLILFTVKYSFLMSWFITGSRSHANPQFVSCGFLTISSFQHNPIVPWVLWFPSNVQPRLTFYFKTMR